MPYQRSPPWGWRVGVREVGRTRVTRNLSTIHGDLNLPRGLGSSARTPCLVRAQRQRKCDGGCACADAPALHSALPLVELAEATGLYY
jgi:hypothetical protein